MWKRAADLIAGRRNRGWCHLFGLITVVLILTACDVATPLHPPSRRSDSVVKIGLVAPFEGRHREVGYDVIYSARLAIREANEASEPEQTKALLVAVDDFGDPEIARESAEAMAVDLEVMAVIGHWLPETTAAARPIYQMAGLALVEAGQGDFGPQDPASLPADFLTAYEDVTPFDETAGPYAGSAYDGVSLILAAIEEIEADGEAINRANVSDKLATLSFKGITGTIGGQ
jgi:ABC-type branched-subunit amino acid transport system substrate-binding protein